MDKISQKEFINDMIEGIMKVARGDFSVQINLSGKNDELDSLALGLNMMIDDIRSSVERDKMRVKELEKAYQDLRIKEEKIKTYMEKLEQKNKELDDFTYIVSHDLKAPLITIQGFANLLKKKYGGQFDEKGSHYLDNLVGASNNLNVLITDLLEYSRAGRKEIKRAKISLKDAVKHSLRSLQGMVDQKGANLSFSADLPEISYDPTKLGQVLNNLISNALKYSSPKRSPKIDIGWADKDDEIVLWIKDNGTGIKRDDLDKIFQPFVRVSKEKEGTGIGLSIVKKIVERHGGKIWAESKFGRGSTFYFTISNEVMK